MKKFVLISCVFISILLSLVIILPNSASAASKSKAKVPTVTAYATCRISFGGQSIPFIIPSVTINLKSGNTRLDKKSIVPYNQTITVNSNVLAKGFRFTSVPANNQPMILTINFTDMMGNESTYTCVYKFSCTSKKCGNMGQFTFDMINGNISCK